MFIYLLIDNVVYLRPPALESYESKIARKKLVSGHFNYFSADEIESTKIESKFQTEKLAVQYRCVSLFLIQIVGVFFFYQKIVLVTRKEKFYLLINIKTFKK